MRKRVARAGIHACRHAVTRGRTLLDPFLCAECGSDAVVAGRINARQVEVVEELQVCSSNFEPEFDSAQTSSGNHHALCSLVMAERKKHIFG